MRPQVALELLGGLQATGWERAELFWKQGRSRRFSRALDTGPSWLASQEEGWAVRGSGRSGAMFFAASGRPRSAPRDAVVVAGAELLLPPPQVGAAWAEPPEVSVPLMSEEQARRLIDRAREDLRARAGEARIATATLDDGVSETFLCSSLGVQARFRNRAALLRLDVVAGETLVRSVTAAATCAELQIEGIVDDVVERLRARADEGGGGGGTSDLVVAPEPASKLLAQVAPYFIGRSVEAVAEILQAAGRAVSAEVWVTDDGRRPGGLLSAPVDGEGVTTGRRCLVRDGTVADTLRPWNEQPEGFGCRRRPGWRELPRLGASHLVLEPRTGVSPRDLLADMKTGFHLVDAGDPERDRTGRVLLPVAGFRVRSGRRGKAVAGRLSVDPRRCLSQVLAVGEDLSFWPIGAMIGAPSLLLRGPELLLEV